jgi:hypothetical protein
MLMPSSGNGSGWLLALDPRTDALFEKWGGAFHWIGDYVRFLRGFFNRTPGPPPFSSMNSMPAASPGPKQAGLAAHCGIAGNPANRKR